MAPGRVHLSVADARDLAEGALRGIGFDHDEARIVANHVIDAALCGYEYSGLAKILNIVDSEHFKLPRRPMKVLRETDVSIAFGSARQLEVFAVHNVEDLGEARIFIAARRGIDNVTGDDACSS